MIPMMPPTPIAVANTTAAGAASTVHQYAHSEVMGMDALQQRTEWWFKDVSTSLKPDWLR